MPRNCTDASFAQVLRVGPLCLAVWFVNAQVTFAQALHPNDQSFDNGPVLSYCVQHSIPVPQGNYYIQTTIEWPLPFGGALIGSGGYTYAIGGKNIAATRIIWNGPAGGTMLRYLGNGGRIQQITFMGGLPLSPYPVVAGCGIEVPAQSSPPVGNLVTDQLAIDQCDVGLHYLATPDGNHADQQKHYGLLFHSCPRSLLGGMRSVGMPLALWL